jgi:hypothetical protein
MKNALNWRLKVNNFARKQVNKKGSSEKGFIRKFERHGGISKQGKAHFNDVMVFSFSRTILLMSMRTGHMMSNTRFLKEGI